MRSGTIRPEDRVVWVGDDEFWPVGSSCKAREVTRTHVGVSPIHGTYEECQNNLEWYRRGTQIVSCEEAARRGVEPWRSSLPPSMGGTYVHPPRRREGSYDLPRIFS